MKWVQLPLYGTRVNDAALCADIVNGDNVGMLELGGGDGLVPEASDKVGVQPQLRRQHLDGDVPLESRLAASLDEIDRRRHVRGDDRSIGVFIALDVGLQGFEEALGVGRADDDAGDELAEGPVREEEGLASWPPPPSCS